MARLYPSSDCNNPSFPTPNYLNRGSTGEWVTGRNALLNRLYIKDYPLLKLKWTPFSTDSLPSAELQGGLVVAAESSTCALLVAALLKPFNVQVLPLTSSIHLRIDNFSLLVHIYL